MTWPTWAKVVVSVVIGVHLLSVIAAEMTVMPPSPLEQAVVAKFIPYYQVLDQGHAHRLYSDIGPTAVATAELRFEDGRPPVTIRIPDRSRRPRLLYQRELSLANALSDEAGHSHGDEADHEPPSNRLAESYARHLALTHPGCSGVILRLQLHEIPDWPAMVSSASIPGAPKLDPDSDEFYTTPRRIGDFPWPPK